MMLLRVGVPKRATTWHAVSSASVGLSAVTMTRRQSWSGVTGNVSENQTSTTPITRTSSPPRDEVAAVTQSVVHGSIPNSRSITAMARV